MEIISSKDNQKIKKLSKLLDKKYRDIENKFLVEGEHLVEEALKNNLLLEVIKTEDYDKSYDVKEMIVTYDIIKKLSNTKTPQKIIGVVKKLEEKEIGNKILILDDIQDPGNLGTIIRSCVAFNIDTLVLSNKTVDLYNDKVIRSSEGLIFNLNILRRELKSFIEELHNKDYLVYGTDVREGYDIRDIKLNNKYAIIMGNEGNGVSREILSLCDKNLYIKMSNKCESLNVGVSTSIILYELDRND